MRRVSRVASNVHFSSFFAREEEARSCKSAKVDSNHATANTACSNVLPGSPTDESESRGLLKPLKMHFRSRPTWICVVSRRVTSQCSFICFESHWNICFDSVNWTFIIKWLKYLGKSFNFCRGIRAKRAWLDDFENYLLKGERDFEIICIMKIGKVYQNRL